MANANAGRHLYEFGPYRVDPSRRQLLRQNQPLPLQAKAFDILLVLVENSERVVLKDDLMKTVWPDTFVEESNLSQHIFILRKTLGDAVEEKRYIVTVPGKGYRFAEKVRTVAIEEEGGRPVGADARIEDQIVVARRQLAKVTVEQDKKTGLGLWIAVGVIAAALVLAVSLFWRSQRKPKLTEKDTLVLAEFVNKTGDPVFDGTLRQGLSAQLEQSPFLNLLSDRRISQTLSLMTQPKDARLTHDLAHEVCQRTASAATLEGSIASLGNQYVLGLQAVNCNNGDVLADEQVTANGKEQVLSALGKGASRLRAELGESLTSVQKFDVPLEATTSSLEALRDYSMGVRVYLQQGAAPSIPFFKQAIDLDPNFPMAHAMLSNVYGWLLQPSLSLDYATKAYRLRDRVSEREKLRITEFYFRATGELEKETETCDLWKADYPRDGFPHSALGHIYENIGQYDNALREAQDLMRLAPDIAPSYSALGTEYLFLDRLDESKTTFDQAIARKLDSGILRQQVYVLAFLRGDATQMEQQVAWGAGKPGTEDVLLSQQSDTETYYGRIAKARDFSRRAVDSAARASSRETAALWQVNAALREAELGNASAARQGVAAALALSPGRDVRVIAALALARAGDVLRAQVLADELEKTYPTHTLMKLYWLPVIKAAIDIGKARSPQALVDLEPAAPYELGLADGYINYLYPAYLRGQAYLLAHNGTAAAAEFEKLLNHRGIVQNFVTGALAHLQIARAQAMAGDTAKARAAYQNFLALWKDADSDLPTLKQAKSESAKLQ